uniref:Uncharacterized protein n=1 Tax=Cacopsylla melanoneura TaxID=428564 RepID=A0A8D8T8E7_9HEMI
MVEGHKSYLEPRMMVVHQMRAVLQMIQKVVLRMNQRAEPRKNRKVLVEHRNYRVAQQSVQIVQRNQSLVDRKNLMAEVNRMNHSDLVKHLGEFWWHPHSDLLLMLSLRC